MSSAQPQVSAGAVLAGRWQILDFVGSSDTGEVYGVRDLHGTASFALKLFWPNALAQAEIWSAVQQTARTAAGLGAEGVARAYDFGIDANTARPFFVSERVSWSSLADRVRLHGPLTPAELSTALGVVARALDSAHAAGVVHRDLKPENVFISPDNPRWVRITDFGVALLRSASPPPPGWGGTVGWVAPDAADPNARSQPAMDVFSLGLVAFFALSGGALHRAARSGSIDAAALWQELTLPLDSAALRARELGASVDPAFDAWFQRAVAPMPEARFTSITEMVSAFDAIVRTLVAPQSQNAVALPGIAAAIAQPLIFQADSQQPAPTYGAAPALAEPPLGATAPAYAPPVEDAPSSALPGVRKRTAAPLLIGGAMLCLALTALGIGALSHRRAAALASASPAAAQSAAAIAATAAASSASAAASATPPSALASAAPEPPSTETAAAVAVAAAPVAASATSKALVPAKPVTAGKPVATAKPALTAKPVAATTAKVASTPAKTATSKPASATLKVAAKPAVLSPPKKKCGSTFIPCK